MTLYRKGVRPIGLSVLALAALALAMPAGARNESTEPGKVVRVNYYDWLKVNKPRQTKEQPTKASVRRVEIGTGSWICSPAGFGQKSRCHAN